MSVQAETIATIDAMIAEFKQKLVLAGEALQKMQRRDLKGACEIYAQNISTTEFSKWIRKLEDVKRELQTREKTFRY